MEQTGRVYRSEDVIRLILLRNPGVERVDLVGFPEPEAVLDEEFFYFSELIGGKPLSFCRQVILNTDFLTRALILSGEAFVGLNSRVRDEDGYRHIPMMDYDRGNGKESVRKLHSLIDELEWPEGLILRSGKGLHYMGTELITDGEFQRTNERLEQLVGKRGFDVHWFRSCSVLGFWRLRLNGLDGSKKPVTPQVVSVHERSKSVGVSAYMQRPPHPRQISYV
jgi:hypothetical protein